MTTQAKGASTKEQVHPYSINARKTLNNLIAALIDEALGCHDMLLCMAGMEGITSIVLEAV